MLLHNLLPLIKRTSLLLILNVLLFLATAGAQPPQRGQGWGGQMPSPAESAQSQTQLLVDSLHLSAAQEKKVHAVFQQFAEKWQEDSRQSEPGNWEVMRARMSAHRQEQDQALRPFLTTEQWEHYLRIREQQDQSRQKQRRRD